MADIDAVFGRHVDEFGDLRGGHASPGRWRRTSLRFPDPPTVTDAQRLFPIGNGHRAKTKSNPAVWHVAIRERRTARHAAPHVAGGR